MGIHQSVLNCFHSLTADRQSALQFQANVAEGGVWERVLFFLNLDAFSLLK